MPTLPPRAGPRPDVSTVGPQTQLSQRSSPELWERVVAAVFAMDGVEEGRSQVSPASSRAVFVTGRPEAIDPSTSLFPEGRLEPIHIHGAHDTSLHVVLPSGTGSALVELGWAEPHQYADFGTEFLVYGPRDDDELAIVLMIVRESLAFARGAPGTRGTGIE